MTKDCTKTDFVIKFKSDIMIKVYLIKVHLKQTVYRKRGKNYDAQKTNLSCGRQRD